MGSIGAIVVVLGCVWLFGKGIPDFTEFMENEEARANGHRREPMRMKIKKRGDDE